MGFIKSLLWTVVIVVGTVWFVAKMNAWRDSIGQSPSAPAKALSAPAPKPTPAQLWGYSANEGAMGYLNRQAQIDSTTMLNFGFPYEGAQPLTMTLRNHAKHGREVIFSIKQGQFLCDSTDCSMEVRFDGGKPMNFEGSPPQDNRSTAIFLQGYDRFYSRMIKAKRVVVAPTFFQEGAPAVEFDVSGFNAGAYEGRPQQPRPKSN